MFKHTVLLVLTTLLSLSTSAEQSKSTVSISGSTSVARVMEVLADTYNEQQNTVYIAVHGTGSAAGIAAVKSGVTELGMSSRYLKLQETDPNLVLTEIAQDAIALVVHPDNPVNSITSEQVKKVYQRDITNWAALGGTNAAMAVVSRENASGTRFSFESSVDLLQNINGESVSNISRDILVANSNSMVKTLVNHNIQAVGYASLGSVDTSIKALAIDGIAPTETNLASGDYQLNRPFMLIHQDGKLSPQAQQFVKFVLSEQGQSIISDLGYLSIK